MSCVPTLYLEKSIAYSNLPQQSLFWYTDLELSCLINKCSSNVLTKDFIINSERKSC